MGIVMVYKRINSVLYLTPKLMYIVVNLEYFLFYSFRHLFLESRKIGSTMITFTFMAMQFVTFFSNMGVAYFADSIQKPKLVLIGCLLLSALTFQLLFLPLSNLFCCFFFILYSTFILCTVPLLDRIVLEYLQKVMNAPSSIYGRQRVFGTFTYLITNYITEMLVFEGNEKRFNRLQIPYLLYAALAAGTVFVLAPRDRVVSRESQRRDRPQLSKVLKNKAYLFFLLIILMNGITRGVLTVYLSSYYKTILNFNELTPPKSVPGPLRWIAQTLVYKNPVSTCNTFGVILEIGIFFASKTLLQWFGLYWAFLISQVAQGLRFFCYTKIAPTDPYRFEKACAIEMLKGVNFGLTHLSGVQLAVLLVPSNLKSTSQMIYAGTFVCFGGMLGAFLGFFYKIESIDGAVSMFWAGTVLSMLAVALIIIKYGCIDKKLWGSAAREIPEQMPSSEPSRATLQSEVK
ncbi:hypothetical protein NEHOM01_1862 [Nematocida homosporus]|uniref:uncharacterized protein n=1 Tax=Nematocida homosporus TaxID=1912981 RepID=UPI00221F4877|nr:uncharacterized protein NEHOM01_1862 [Nematocida homosporus]KAI5187010.1 hypothetical protein NEHOM01_1862 [Nematocida homosporus]